MDLAAAEGIPLKVEPIPRELLYVADELFFAYVSLLTFYLIEFDIIIMIII